MACAVLCNSREIETGSPRCTGSPPSRKIEKFGLGGGLGPRRPIGGGVTRQIDEEGVGQVT